ncbi:hypothetical protein TNCV_357081 [Trichonephila clavipes]|nr:hypothetical protein TNCV_357081 [Trichonephila clavipes]
MAKDHRYIVLQVKRNRSQISGNITQQLRTATGCQTDHLIGTTAHAPQRPMVTHTGMDTVGPSWDVAPLSLSFYLSVDVP